MAAGIGIGAATSCTTAYRYWKLKFDKELKMKFLKVEVRKLSVNYYSFILIYAKELSSRKL